MMKPTDLLHLLRNKQGSYISGEELSNLLNVSRTAVWKHIHQLEKAGYTIEAAPHLGYRLLGTPDRLLPDEIRAGLESKCFGQTLYSYNQTTSTNDRALELATARAPEGTVVTAEFQTRGRGRRERTWISKSGFNLLFSVIFRPPWIAEQGAFVTLIMAVAVATGIREETGLEVTIKWPNDILYQDYKVAGILTEMQAQADRIEYIVSGAGININSSPGGTLRYPATSLAKLAGQPIARLPLLRKILVEIERWYAIALKVGTDRILGEWDKLSCMNGSQIAVLKPSGEILEGMAMGVDTNGALLLRLDSGLTQRITSGEVSRIKPEMQSHAK